MDFLESTIIRRGQFLESTIIRKRLSYFEIYEPLRILNKLSPPQLEYFSGDPSMITNMESSGDNY